MSRLSLAVIASVALILAAPWIGTIRAWIQTAFPGRFGLIVNLVVIALVVAAIVMALVRIRVRRALRYSALALALVVAIASAAATASPSASQNAVERFHFVSYGLITFLFYRVNATRDATDLSVLILPIAAALIVGTVDEWFQWFVPLRYGELRDIVLNAAAIGAGLLFSLGVSPPARLSFRIRRESIPRVAASAAALSMAVAVFTQVVHLGHLVADEETGAFRSRYTSTELLALSVARAAAWQAAPPPTQPPRMAREDQYLAEGVWHIMARNAAWDQDIARSWHENLILEKYFGAVLDTASYAAPVSRWPAAQRSDAEARAAATGRAGFISQAERHRIYAWPSVWLWSITAVLVAGLMGIAVRARPSV